MPASNPATNPATSSAAASQTQIPDTQTLIALLGNLMPLLMHLQQTLPFQLGPFGTPVPTANPALDQQAANAFVEDMTAESVHALSSYLDTHAARVAGLEACRPIVARAAQCRAARDYAQAFELIWQVYRVIAALRAANPDLPPIRRAGQDESASQSAARH
jgi:hypothetical protein